MVWQIIYIMWGNEIICFSITKDPAAQVLCRKEFNNVRFKKKPNEINLPLCCLSAFEIVMIQL